MKIGSWLSICTVHTGSASVVPSAVCVVVPSAVCAS